MAKVKVLIEGYAKESENGWIASSTTCLIISDDKKIITDPGCNREKLLSALKKEDLTTGDIDYVFLSHCHPDHILLAGIFEKAKFVTFDGNLVYDNDLSLKFDKDILRKDVEIVETPGHVIEHLSLVVNTSDGKDHAQAKGMDMKVLIESRKKLLEKADFIIPGHGKMFKVKKLD